MEWKDPIVEEVRQARERLWDSCGRDPKKLLAYIKRKQLEHPERLADVKPVKPRKVRRSA